MRRRSCLDVYKSGAGLKGGSCMWRRLKPPTVLDQPQPHSAQPNPQPHATTPTTQYHPSLQVEAIERHFSGQRGGPWAWLGAAAAWLLPGASVAVAAPLALLLLFLPAALLCALLCHLRGAKQH